MGHDATAGGNEAAGLRATIWRLAAQSELSEEETIQGLLDAVGPALGVARASFNRVEGEHLVCAIEWCAPGVTSSLGGRLPAAIVGPLLANGSFEATPSGAAGRVPNGLGSAAAAVFGEHALTTGTTSFVALPYVVAGQVEGSLTFKRNDLVEPGWSRPFLPLLGEVTQIITQTIAHKRAEAALRESERRFRELVDLLPLGVLEVDFEGHITFANRHARLEKGLTDDDLRTGVDLRRFVSPRDANRVPTHLLDGPAGANHVGTEVELQRADGTTYQAALYSTPIVRDGKPVRILGIEVDITARKHAEEERRQLEAQVLHAQRLESLGLLAGGIAHDFNNLMLGVLGNAELALIELDGHPTAAPRLERIRRSARRAAELANQMLAFSGQGQVRIEPVDIGALLRQLRGELGELVPPSVTLRLAAAPELPAVDADAAQLRQVVTSLVANAAEALGDGGGGVTVSAGVAVEDRASLAQAHVGGQTAPGRFVFVEVADTGCGMDAATQARMFDPFFSTKFFGRGLGLAAVLGIVRSHAGAIKVRTAPDAGTTVRVLFPVRERPTAPVTAPAVGLDASVPERSVVLVVDDEPEVLTVAAEMLRVLGQRSRTAPGGAEALEIVARERAALALVLLDITMPRMSGEEAFDRIVAVAPELPIVLMSGYTEGDITSRFAGRRPAGFLSKPFDLDDLARRVRAVRGEGE